MPILFYGDPHKRWDPLFEAVRAHRPEHVVLMGDMELDRPLRDVVAPVTEAGARTWWIHGNHDAHTAEMWSNLFEGLPEGELNERSVRMECADGAATVAGLGGHYRGKVWYPREGGEAPVHASRAEFLLRHGKGGRFRGGMPLGQRQSIFPDMHASLAALRGVDILVAHEAPLSMPDRTSMGFGAVDDLARDMGVRLVLHGHHHFSYLGATRDGIPVRGVGLAEAFLLSPGDLP